MLYERFKHCFHVPVVTLLLLLCTTACGRLATPNQLRGDSTEVTVCLLGDGRALLRVDEADSALADFS